VGAQQLEAVLRQLLHRHVLLERVQRHATVHARVPCTW
jgi:hypothetical protein